MTKAGKIRIEWDLALDSIPHVEELQRNMGVATRNLLLRIALQNLKADFEKCQADNETFRFPAPRDFR